MAWGMAVTDLVLLVCGGRDYADREHVFYILDHYKPRLVIQGGARGADDLAHAWCMERGVHCAEVRALWDAFGKSAGSRRNVAMMLLKPTAVVAFPGGVGTNHMVQTAVAAGIQVVDLRGGR